MLVKNNNNTEHFNHCLSTALTCNPAQTAAELDDLLCEVIENDQIEINQYRQSINALATFEKILYDASADKSKVNIHKQSTIVTDLLSTNATQIVAELDDLLCEIFQTEGIDLDSFRKGISSLMTFKKLLRLAQE